LARWQIRNVNNFEFIYKKRQVTQERLNSEHRKAERGSRTTEKYRETEATEKSSIQFQVLFPAPWEGEGPLKTQSQD
jgi:hypothetical protein